ncbi:MAG: NAD(P)-dependent oxidoreductase [Clostridium argentinense]|uniref:NAD(P)-dependent oxidoreductase n=1 Tax=Clostridium faecium TaxID=2762223 RepID=A0ABR8YTK5_9CLOT|nr:NAD(P)-dependent oxidoreductase [Clostridium faecium]MBD8047597.1 NAD(P)-dependent oxidoreductase [Clostridium faecium]MBS5824543.1 NAD(P)-dependent oxidoreductase [Clostridium argentinense]MDU1350017.1 NAD(P)-dependent oxidoreductase [Clostridium argentinense]
MKIALIGATGNVGKVILKEALLRGHEVTAIVRNISKVNDKQDNLKVIEGDIFDEERLSKIIEGKDIVISAFGPKQGEEKVLVDATKSLIKSVKKAGVPRLLSMGGAGSLLVEEGIKLVETKDFPSDWKPIALAHGEALEQYRQEKNLNWTNLSPAAFIEPGKRTGVYRTSEDYLVVDEKGVSRISFEDFAFAMLDEVEKSKFSRKRFTVGY